MKKRTKIFIIILIILLIAGGGLYYYFFMYRAPVSEEAQLTEEERARLTLTDEEIERGVTLEEKIADIEEERQQALEQGEELPEIVVEEVGVQPIIYTDINQPMLSADGNNLFYFDEYNKDFYVSGLDGSDQKAITDLDLDNVYDIEWSETRDKAIVVQSADDGRTREYSLVNLRDGSVIKYDRRIQNVTLDPTGNKIAYLYKDDETGASNIAVANEDATDYKTLYPYYDENVEIDYFDEDYVEFHPQVSGYKESDAAIASIEERSIRLIVAEKFGVKTLYSPNKSKVLYSANEGKNPRQLGLFLTDGQGMREGSYLGINTLVDKCAWWGNTTLYCAVPSFYVDSLVMPNDYYNSRFISQDNLYRINAETLEVELIYSADESEIKYDIFEPFLSFDGGLLYFTDRISGLLHSLSIPNI